jgi:hypothetical protein
MDVHDLHIRHSNFSLCINSAKYEIVISQEMEEGCEEQDYSYYRRMKVYSMLQFSMWEDGIDHPYRQLFSKGS